MSVQNKVMLLLTYTPREGVSLDQYHEWLRKIDNPFFNSRPSVRHYENWRVVDAKLGSSSFTHFDLLEIDGLNGFDQVFSDPVIVEFASNWVRMWGKVPDASPEQQSMNYQVFVCERLAAPRGR